jgi:hypothetical protein
VGGLLSRAASVGPISAVKVKLSLAQGQLSHGQVGLTTGVDGLTLGGTGVSRIGVARISNVAVDAGVTVTRNGADPQDIRSNKTKLARNNEKRLNIFLFMFSFWVGGGTFGLSQICYLFGK